jgi:DNA-binding MarR family transcriptional regulator
MPRDHVPPQPPATTLTAYPGEDEYGLETGLLIREVLRLMERNLEARTAAEDVSIGMWLFLRALWQRDGATQRELSRMVGIKEPSTVSALTRMEERGFIRRERDTEDRRRIHVWLTPLGRDLRPKLQPMIEAMREDTYRGLDTGERQQLRNLLARLRDNLADRKRTG